MNAIETTDVTKRYGDVVALDELSLTVEAGTTFGLLGTNGAGKSTLFRLLVGHARPDAGRLEVAGMDVADAGRDVRRIVGYLPERTGFPAALSGREVLEFHARMRGIDPRERAERVDDTLASVGLGAAADRTVGGYSNGMNRRLGLATALLHRPRLLLLDEPTAGLDPTGVADLHTIVERLHEQRNLTVVLSSHVLPEVEALCDDVAILHNGRLRAEGAVADFRTGDDVVVRLRIDGAGATPVHDVVSSYGVVRSTGGDSIEVECPLRTVPRLLDDALATGAICGYQVNEPGLERVFERAVGGAGEGREGSA